MSPVPNDDRISNPIAVEVKNWASPIKLPVVRRSTVHTYIVGVSGWQPLCGYEPNRLRMAIYVVDSAVALLTNPPTASPDQSTSAVANSGACLFAGSLCYEFFGPDEFYLNSLGGTSRVTVVKEYGD